MYTKPAELYYTAKSMKTEKSAYGQLLRVGDKYYIIESVKENDIFTHGYITKGLITDMIEVKPETIRRYINKKDRTGTKIFVGDKVRGNVWHHWGWRTKMLKVVEEDGCILFEDIKTGDRYTPFEVDMLSLEIVEE